MIICPKCGAVAPQGAFACQKCGAVLTKAPNQGPYGVSAAPGYINYSQPKASVYGGVSAYQTPKALSGAKEQEKKQAAVEKPKVSSSVFGILGIIITLLFSPIIGIIFNVIAFNSAKTPKEKSLNRMGIILGSVLMIVYLIVGTVFLLGFFYFFGGSISSFN